MIIVWVLGGLGNQLFQYALGRALALKYNTSLKLDLSDFSGYGRRIFRLNHFDLHFEVASAADIAAVTGQRFWDRLLRRKKGITIEGFPRFNPDVLECGCNAYLKGYWQSEKYFSDVAEVIRGEVRMTTPPEGQNAELWARIGEGASVGIHIRRGDYAEDATTKAYHGLCSVEYYQRAIALIAARVEKPKFFVFSDDPDWASENLRLAHPFTLVRHNGATADYEDFRLLCRCKHFITANSSFSWWAAWLGSAPDKVVVAPQRWFAHDNYSYADLVPAHWVSLDSA